MSHPQYPGGDPPEQGSDPWRPTGTYRSAASPPDPPPPPPPPPGSPGAPQWPPQPTSPQPGYPTSPPPGPVVPSQPAGVHDNPTQMGYTPGAATPSPYEPPSPPPYEPPSSIPPGQTGFQTGPGWSELGAPQPAPPSRGKGSPVGLIVVSAVAGLLLIFGGIATFMWIGTSNDLDETRTDLTSQVEELEGTVANRDSQVEGLEDQLEEAREEIEVLETATEGLEGEIEFLNDANDAIGSCLDSIDEWFALILLEASDAEIDDFYNNEVIPTCEEADQYR